MNGDKREQILCKSLS